MAFGAVLSVALIAFSCLFFYREKLFASTLSGVHVYPVPFVPSKGDTVITFTGLPSAATIKIFSAGGHIVQVLEETDGDGLLLWDVRNSDGSDVAPGVYLYDILTRGDEKTGKLVVVR